MDAAIWKSILSGPRPPPLCSGHKEPCVLRTVKIKGPNQGRQFHCCARPQGHSSNPEARCNFFKWVKWSWFRRLCKYHGVFPQEHESFKLSFSKKNKIYQSFFKRNKDFQWTCLKEIVWIHFYWIEGNIKWAFWKQFYQSTLMGNMWLKSHFQAYSLFKVFRVWSGNQKLFSIVYWTGKWNLHLHIFLQFLFKGVGGGGKGGGGVVVSALLLHAFLQGDETCVRKITVNQLLNNFISVYVLLI